MANGEGKGFGAALRKAREAAGRDIRELAETTRIQGRYLEALEAEDWRSVPKGLIGRGFIRILARELGVPAAELLQLYRAGRGDDEAEPQRSVPEVDWKVDVRAARRGRPILLTAGAAVVAVLGLWRWGPWSRPSPPARPPEEIAAPAAPARPAEAPAVSVTSPPSPGPQPSAAPGPAVPADGAPGVARAPAGAAAARLVVEAVERVWVRVEPEGGQPEERVLKPGERAAFEGRGPFRVKVSNGAAARLFWNGEPLGAPGASSGVASVTVPTSPATLRP